MCVMCVWWACFVGCAAPPDRYDAQRRPADFVLRVTLEAAGDGTEADDADLPTPPGQYVVTPDRELRVALGPGATAGVYPPRTAVLSPEEMDALWRLTVEAWRSARRENTSAVREKHAAGLRVRVRFRGGGVSRSFAAPLRDEGARALVSRLVSLRGGELKMR